MVTLEKVDAGYGVRLVMPRHMYFPGSQCFLTAEVLNPSEGMMDYPLFVMLEAADQYWFAPTWTYGRYGYDFYRCEFEPGVTKMPVIPEFIWPDDIGTANNIIFWGFLADHGLTHTIGEVDTFTFGWK